MNFVFAILLVASALIAAATGTISEVGAAVVNSARSAVDLALGLLGQLTLWLGLLAILERAGAVAALGRALRPLIRRIFPEVPSDHPAIGSMVMNFAANMLGLGNAATPFGLKAMEQLESLNPNPGTATNAMAIFLAINTTGLAVLPISTIAIRASLGSHAPYAIVLPTMFASLSAALAAVTVAKLLERRTGNIQEMRIGTPPPSPPPAGPRAKRSYAALALGIALGIAVLFALFRAGASEGAAGALRKAGTSWLVPLLIAGIAILGLGRGVPVFETFVEGAKEGIRTTVRVFPYLVGMVVAIGMLRASRALDAIESLAGPIVNSIGFPPEALPMALMRPLSGSGAMAVMADALAAHGPDSFIGNLVSTINGGTETTFYVLALYFGAVGVKKWRHTLLACLTADVVAPLAGLAACHLFFR